MRHIYSNYRQPKAKSRKRFFLLLIILFIAGFFFFRGDSKSEGESHKLADLFELSKQWRFGNEVTIETKKTDPQDQTLVKILNDSIQDQPGKYAFCVKSLKDPNRQALINADEKMLSASLYKLFLISAALEQVRDGKMSYETVISGNTQHLESVLGFVDSGYDGIEGGISYTLDDTLSRIARVSNNYAAIMLAEKVGWGSVQASANAIGATSTVIKSPISTTARDICTYYEKVYQKQAVGPEYSDKIIELLASAEINNRIPKKLPQGLKIAHKTGELAGMRHDAGIVFFEPEPYIIVLMSDELKGEDSGIELLSEISKKVYDYFVSINPEP